MKTLISSCAGFRPAVSPFAAIARLSSADAAQTSPSSPSAMDLAVLTSRAADLMEGRAMGHAMRVAMLALELADALTLAPRRKSALLFAALLHDVGLIPIAGALAPRLPVGVSEKRWFAAHPLLSAGLSAPVCEPFETLEMPENCQSLMASHPTRAKEIVASLRLSGDVSAVIAAMHEHLDGSGFPKGLSGDRIPVESRILAIADALDAMLGDINSATTRPTLLGRFFQSDAANGGALFDPTILAAARSLWFSESSAESSAEASLSGIYSANPEREFRRRVTPQQYPNRFSPLSGEALLSIAQTLGALSDSLLPLYFDGHSARVARVGLAMAHHLEIPAEACGALAIAGLTQNLGMLAVPAGILAKPQPLTHDQRLAVHDHARFTGELLGRTPGFTQIAVWAAEHHERMNGSGYYQGRKGRDISVAGRILALADVYSALISPRPYREAFEPSHALAVIQQGKLRLFDSLLTGVLRQSVAADAR